LGIAFTQPAFFVLGETRKIGFTTTGNAATVKVVDIPAGWTVAVTKTGSAGTFTDTALSAGVNGDALVLVSDDAGSMAMRSLGLAIFRAASAQTWTFGSSTLTWSDAIRIPDCNKSDFTNDSNNPQCRSYTSGTNTWYYYNWPYVNQNAGALCPSPWRVPTRTDFTALVGATNYTTLVAQWGYGGYAGSSMYYVSERAYCWSSTEDPNNTNIVYNLSYYNSGNLTVPYSSKDIGFQVRCVK
jgi:hypothetical protein